MAKIAIVIVTADPNLSGLLKAILESKGHHVDVVEPQAFPDWVISARDCGYSAVVEPEWPGLAICGPDASHIAERLRSTDDPIAAPFEVPGFDELWHPPDAPWARLMGVLVKIDKLLPSSPQ